MDINVNVVQIVVLKVLSTGFYQFLQVVLNEIQLFENTSNNIDTSEKG